MPLTVSHAAASGLFSPLSKRGFLPPAALALGTMVPDFEYFYRLDTISLWSHSLAGLFAFCLPVGLVCVALWEFAVQPAVIDLLQLPESRTINHDVRWWLFSAVAILLGAATHLTWDGLTHRGGWVANLIPGFQSRTIAVLGGTLNVAVIVDYGSTLVGGAIVLWWFLRHIKRAKAAPTSQRLATLAAIICLSAVLGALNGRRSPMPDVWSIQLAVGRTAIGAMLGVVLSLIALGAVHRITQRQATTAFGA